MDRRTFLFTSVAAGTVAGLPAVAHAGAAPGAAPESDREYWVGVLRRLADPVLVNLANGTLRARMPVEPAPARRARSRHEAPSDGRARIDARHRASAEQLAAVFCKCRGRADAARRGVGSRPRRLRAAAARPVVQGRRRVRRWAGVSLGLLQ